MQKNKVSAHCCLWKYPFKLPEVFCVRAAVFMVKIKKERKVLYRLTYKLWAQNPSPPWGLWWCEKHHSWQEQHSHKAVCTAREVGLSLSRSAAYDLEKRNNNTSENPSLNKRKIFGTLCTLFTSSYDMGDNVQVSLQVFTAQVLKRKDTKEFELLQEVLYR